MLMVQTLVSKLCLLAMMSLCCKAHFKRVSQIKEALRATGAYDPSMFTPYGYSGYKEYPTTAECNVSDTKNAEDAFLASARQLDNTLDIIKFDSKGMFGQNDVYPILQAATAD